MKKTLLSSLTILAAAFPALSQSAVAPLEWEGVAVQKVSPNGRYIMAQDMGGNSYVRDMSTDRIYTYAETYPGDSNCLSDNGVLVGEDINSSQALLMANGRTQTPRSMTGYYLSCLEGITPDGSTAVGYVMEGSTQLPVVLDVNRDKIQILPYPDKDAAGEEPQGVALHAVSGDGRVAAGILVDSDGFCYTPIVYRLSDTGVWEYTVPDMEPFGSAYAFGGFMAVSPDGSLVTVARIVGDLTNPYASAYVPYAFDVATGEFFELPSSEGNLLPTQILEDGSVMAMSSPTAFMAYTAYILLPDADDFILFSDYMKEELPEYYEWLDETLGQDGIIGYDENGDPEWGHYIITGLISVSNEFVTIAGGLPEGDFFSYVYYDIDRASGIGSVTAPDGPADTRCYNLNGIPVNTDDISTLSRGIYIINGKKVLLRK